MDRSTLPSAINGRLEVVPSHLPWPHAQWQLLLERSCLSGSGSKGTMRDGDMNTRGTSKNLDARDWEIGCRPGGDMGSSPQDPSQSR
jgi:hypothetical protein